MNDEKNVIGNYQIISVIDSGAFGRVYLAHHNVLLKRVVALKLMHTIPLSSEQERQQFLHEAQILELLQHPYILPILDVGLHEGTPYIVSEYAVGNSLRQRLKKLKQQPLVLDTAQTIILQIGQALQYAHDRQVIHRDIKPENILFNAKNDALLADFGLATILETASFKYVSSAGTPRYMAPEQFRGQVSRESDQYALGCIAYELFTGQAPFQLPDPLALIYAHANSMPEPPTQHKPDLPVYIEQAILKALAKQRHERHRDVNAFLAALQAPGDEQTLKHNPYAAVATIQLAPPTPQPELLVNDINGSSQPGERPVTQTSKHNEDNLSGSFETAPLLSRTSEGGTIRAHSTQQKAAAKAIPPPHMGGQSSSGLAVKRLPRYFWLLILFVCITLIVSISINITGNLTWILHATSLASHGQPRGIAAAGTQARQTPPTASIPTSIVRPTRTARSTPASTASTATAQSTPTPGVQPTPTARPLISKSYYVCGDQVSLTNTNYWNTVQPGATVNTSDYAGPVNGYAGPGGDLNKSPGNCSGLYHWAWNQNPVQAMWSWSNASLPNGTCSVDIHIPSWYAGAPDALYSLSISSTSDSSAYNFDVQNQNQQTTTWVTLHINNQTPSIAMPKSTNSIYTLTLTLKNGSKPNWYLGADAIRFNCAYRA
ncbi:MAG TPA: serine/threonine-protein kinase [Ktedonobacteraceae bacterium]